RVELAAENLQLRARLFARVTRRQPGRHFRAAIVGFQKQVASRRVMRAKHRQGGKRDPEVFTPARAGELAGGYSDHSEGKIIDPDLLAHDLRVAGKAVLPQVVAEDDDRFRRIDAV